MGDLTTNLPKPMLDVEGKPVLEHIVEGLRDEAGIRDIFIIIGWQGHVIRDYFGDGKRWKVNITYGEQKVQDGTGKAPEVAKEWVGTEPFLLASGDILSTEYAVLVESFQEDGVMALKAGEDLTKGGAVVLNDQGFMTTIVEKGASSQIPDNAYYNAAIYVLPARIFRLHLETPKIATRRVRTDGCPEGFRSGWRAPAGCYFATRMGRCARSIGAG